MDWLFPVVPHVRHGSPCRQAVRRRLLPTPGDRRCSLICLFVSVAPPSQGYGRPRKLIFNVKIIYVISRRPIKVLPNLPLSRSRRRARVRDDVPTCVVGSSTPLEQVPCDGNGYCVDGHVGRGHHLPDHA